MCINLNNHFYFKFTNDDGEDDLYPCSPIYVEIEKSIEEISSRNDKIKTLGDSIEKILMSVLKMEKDFNYLKVESSLNLIKCPSYNHYRTFIISINELKKILIPLLKMNFQKSMTTYHHYLKSVVYYVG